MTKHLMAAFAFTLALAAFPGNANAGADKNAEPKEWTFLIFLNGHNNLDRFGAENIRGMEQVGSTDKVNIVVQWASLANKTTKRLLVEKSTNPFKVTSPILETLAPVDMGDYKELVNFVEWGARNFPAKHYFVSVWNHGNGWHLSSKNKDKNQTPGFHINDISYDDLTNNHITTEQLAEAMSASAKIIGHNVDIYGSDACLMGMAEVAGEMADSVDYFVGSEEVEPGEGWPYATFMKSWNALPDATPREVAKTLSRDYLAAYSGGIYGTSSVTMSAYDLSKLPQFNKAVGDLSAELQRLNSSDFAKVKYSANSTIEFTNGDYKDFGDFVGKMNGAITVQTTRDAIVSTQAALNQLVIANDVSSAFKGVSGVAIWLPTNSYEYSSYAKRYEGLKFAKATNWGGFLKILAK